MAKNGLLGVKISVQVNRVHYRLPARLIRLDPFVIVALCVQSHDCEPMTADRRVSSGGKEDR